MQVARSASSVFGRIMLSMTGLKKELDRSDQAAHNLRYYSAASGAPLFLATLQGSLQARRA